ncbi:MAG TPA: cation:proton antiporter [Trebonia sp.]|jgi:Kef-type K+ transport system membrane component KefB|nr:cation:proton antiporter [Trebonia sp.]
MAALAVPMGLGIACVLLYRSGFTAIGEPHAGRSFVLYMGVAMSITAMPVLAAIVRERGLAGTTAGEIAMAVAGVMDVLAWLVLAAALIGTGQGGRFSWPVTLVLTVCFVAVMLIVVRPALAWWTSRSNSLLSNPVPVAFALAMASAWATSNLGLQPVFGGLLAGLTMRPRNGALDADVVRSLEQASGLLLPLNTRGLTELIALNVGLQAGLINQRLFTVLVLMALLTTLMTGPLLAWIRPARASLPATTMRLSDVSQDQ